MEDITPKDVEQPLPLLSVLTRPVLTSIANYATLALLDMAAVVLLPLVWSTPIELGGLGMGPASIGLWTSMYGIMSAVFQYALFPRVVARFGPRRVIITGVSSFAITFILFPLENVVARRATDKGTEVVAVWLLIMLQLLSIAISDMAFSKVHVTCCRGKMLKMGTCTWILLRLCFHVRFFCRTE
jgi:MFS family permease